MIIKDLRGGELELSKSLLTEVTGYYSEPYFVKLRDLRASGGGIAIYPVSHPQDPLSEQFSTATCTIGCREFSPATFAKILKAAGVKPVRKTDKKRKPAKKGKKS